VVFVCRRWSGYLPHHTSTTAEYVMNRLHKKLHGLEHGKAKVSLWQWTVRRSSPCGGEIFRNYPKQTLAPTQPSAQWTPKVKRPGRCVDHPHPPSAEVKERVEIYRYSLSGAAWPVTRWTLLLPLYNKPCRRRGGNRV